MSRWFRVYDEAMNDPKVQRLAPHLFKAWFNILCLANKAGNGVLPPFCDIAFALRMSDTDTQSALDELILAGLIDISPDNSLIPHNWKSRQAPSDKSKERTKKWRQGKKDKAGDGHGDGGVTGGDEKCDALDPDPDKHRKEIEPSNVEQDAARGVFENVNLGVGLGIGEVSVDAKRDVCKMLGLADCEPLVENFKRWKPSRRARDVDAHFRAFAKRNIARLSEAELQRIRLPVPEPPPITPAKPSSSLLKTLKVGRYAN